MIAVLIMTTPDDITADELAMMALFFKFLRSYGGYLAGTVGIFSILLASPIFPRNVSLIPENPLFVVDLKSFGNSLLSEVAKSNITGSTVERLNRTWGVKLGETDGYYEYFREWYPRSGTWNKKAWKDDLPVMGIRMGLAEVKQRLGYRDEDTRHEVVKDILTTPNVFPLEALIYEPSLLSAMILGWSGPKTSGWSYVSVGEGSDVFYNVIETLPEMERLKVYRELIGSSRCYSWFVLQNLGDEDEYDVRITANVRPSDLNMEALNSYGIAVEQALGDSVRLRVGNLAPGKDRYKIILINNLPSPPVKREDVRLDRKPLTEQLANHWLLLLTVPLFLALLETGYERLRAKKSSTI